MRWFVAILVVLGLTGVGLFVYSTTLPVYTDPNAPFRISEELSDKPREERFREWYARLSAYETGHKKFSDYGRGLLAAAIGLAATGGLVVLYQRNACMRRRRVIFGVWLGLWALRIPFSFWYYHVRQERFDYPTWGDSTAIPVAQESLVWMVCALLSSTLLWLSLGRRRLAERVHFILPRSASSWFRSALLSIWLLILAFCIVPGVADGDEGTVFSCLVASAIIVIVLSMPEAKPIGKEAATAPEQVVS
jgi:hypothetical protein